MHSQDSVASKLAGNISTTRSTRSTQADVGQQVGFLALPREIRDNVYFNLVVATDPVQYDEDFRTLSRSDTFSPTALMWMFEEGSNSQVAQESREAFYQHNTFLIYTHDIPALLEAKVHAMVFEVAEDAELSFYCAAFEAGAYVRNLAVRVGWHTSDGWFTDSCCVDPANDLQLLLDWDSLRSVIIDARFGAWTYGYPQGIGWDLLEEMKEKWGTEFRIYNDQMRSQDTRRYTSGRNDLSITRLAREIEWARTGRISDEQTEVNEDEEIDFGWDAGTVAEDEDEDVDEDEDEEEGENEEEETKLYEVEDGEEGEDEDEGTQTHEESDEEYEEETGGKDDQGKDGKVMQDVGQEEAEVEADGDDEERWSGEEAHLAEGNPWESVDDRSW